MKALILKDTASRKTTGINLDKIDKFERFPEGKENAQFYIFQAAGVTSFTATAKTANEVEAVIMSGYADGKSFEVKFD